MIFGCTLNRKLGLSEFIAITGKALEKETPKVSGY